MRGAPLAALASLLPLAGSGNEKSGTLARAYLARGRALSKRGQIREAIEDFDQALYHQIDKNTLLETPSCVLGTVHRVKVCASVVSALRRTAAVVARSAMRAVATASIFRHQPSSVRSTLSSG
jgi:tetratricopeptide (TPR) repeat protein